MTDRPHLTVHEKQIAF